MKGVYNIRLRDNKIDYDIRLERKITIIKGKSGTGKSTFCDMIREHNKLSKGSGIHLSSDAKLVVLDVDTDWEVLLESVDNCIIIGDEYLPYLTYKDFGSAVNNSNNYFLFITRSGRLWNLTYAVNSIYELKQKDGVIRAYSKYIDEQKIVKPSVLITEDSN